MNTRWNGTLHLQKSDGSNVFTEEELDEWLMAHNQWTTLDPLKMHTAPLSYFDAENMGKNPFKNDDEKIKRIRKCVSRYELCKYIQYSIYQWEVCPATKRIHAQWYMEFDVPVSLAQVVQIWEPYGRPHAEVANGTADQCILYCTKTESRLDSQTKCPFTYQKMNDTFGLGLSGKTPDFIDVERCCTYQF